MINKGAIDFLCVFPFIKVITCVHVGCCIRKRGIDFCVLKVLLADIFNILEGISSSDVVTKLKCDLLLKLMKQFLFIKIIDFLLRLKDFYCKYRFLNAEFSQWKDLV